MTDVSLFRLHALRAAYLFVSAGLAATVWPLVISHSLAWPLMNSVVGSLLAAVAVLAAVGMRYPLQMLPILLFEITWKAIWLLAVAVPLWSANRLDVRTLETVRECLLVAILVPVIPWGYVLDNYVRKPGDRWTRTHDTGSAATTCEFATNNSATPE